MRSKSPEPIQTIFVLRVGSNCIAKVRNFGSFWGRILPTQRILDPSFCGFRGTPSILRKSIMGINKILDLRRYFLANSISIGQQSANKLFLCASNISASRNKYLVKIEISFLWKAKQCGEYSLGTALGMSLPTAPATEEWR